MSSFGALLLTGLRRSHRRALHSDSEIDSEHYQLNGIRIGPEEPPSVLGLDSACTFPAQSRANNGGMYLEHASDPRAFAMTA